MPNKADLEDVFPVPSPFNATAFQAELYRTHVRPEGRRVLVLSLDGVVMFDSKDCFDRANAMSKFLDWLTRVTAFGRPESRPVAPTVAAERPTFCEHCGDGPTCGVCGRGRRQPLTPSVGA
jgi:hypothetical protein